MTALKLAIVVLLYVLVFGGLVPLVLKALRKRYMQRHPHLNDNLQDALDDSINRSIDKVDPHAAERLVP